MAAGIFFFDRFLPDISVSLVCCILSSIVLLIIPVGFVKFFRNGCSCIFGVLASLCFFVLGGALVLYERNSVEYDWSDEDCMYYGYVESSPEAKGKTFCSVVHVSGCVVSGDSSCVSRINRDILLYWLKDSVLSNVGCGDKVCFRSRISRPVSDVEFMGFDYRRFLLSKGISGTAFVFPSGMVFEKADNVSVGTRALRCRDSIVNIYAGWNLDDENRAVVSALTIGDKSELTPEMREAYSAAGTSHVLALSGLHVGILSAILFLLLSPLKKIKYGRFLQSGIVVLILWIFAFVSGLSPSVVRAVTMCSLYLIASVVVENGLSGLYSLVLTAFVMLCYQPFYLFDISFQLSFLAVLSIILFFPFFNSLVKVSNRVLKYLWSIMAVSLSAQLGTLPLILYYFGSFPTYFLLANLIVSPLAVCILSLALASLALEWIPYVGNLCVCILDFFTGMMNLSMKYISGLQGASISSLYINELQMALMYLLIGCLYVMISSRKTSVVVAMLFVACSFAGTEYYKSFNREQPSLFLAWSDVYLKNGKTKIALESVNGIFSVNSVNIALMKTDFWSNKELKSGEEPVVLDYAYICRGFKGDMKSLSRMFVIKKVVLDPSLSVYSRDRIKKQCSELNIPYDEISGQASYRIVL